MSHRRSKAFISAAAVLVLLGESGAAHADGENASALPAEPAPLPAPAPYSLPWQLRPAVAASVVRSDTTVAFAEVAVAGSDPKAARTIATTLLAAYKLAPNFAPLLRIAYVQNSIAEAASLANPVIGATYGLKLAPPLRVALFLGVALPLGAGGGDNPDPKVAAAVASGILARSAMDNAMFAVNYLTVFPGVGVAYVSGGLTVQAELTVLELLRVRGPDTPANVPTRTNLTSGVHVGYFVMPQLSLGGELRYQSWLANTSVPASSPARENLTAAIGARAHIEVAKGKWIRPGLAYALPLDDPMKAGKYNILQVDVPFVF
jgi:hypothetical protein